MPVGPNTLLNLQNSAAIVALGGCVSEGGQKKKKLERRRDAPVLNLASEGFTKANKNLKIHTYLCFHTRV